MKKRPSKAMMASVDQSEDIAQVLVEVFELRVRKGRIGVSLTEDGKAGGWRIYAVGARLETELMTR